MLEILIQLVRSLEIFKICNIHVGMLHAEA